MLEKVLVLCKSGSPFDQVEVWQVHEKNEKDASALNYVHHGLEEYVANVTILKLLSQPSHTDVITTASY